MAQINVLRAVNHNDVDVSEADIEAVGNYEHYMARRAEFLNLPIPTIQAQSAKARVVWAKLNDPQVAVEAAAREIDWVIDNINQNLDKTWQKSFLNGPIDRKDILGNVKYRVTNEKNLEEIRLEKKEALAMLVIAPYNTETIITDDFDLQNPYGKREEGQAFFNAINHANNGWGALVRKLEECGFFKEEKEPPAEKKPPPPPTTPTSVLFPTRHGGFTVGVTFAGVKDRDMMLSK